MAMNRVRGKFLWAMAAILAACADGVGAQEEQKTEWQEFRSDEANFLLWIPAKPTELKVDGCPPGAKVWQASGDSLLTVFQFGFISRQKHMEGSQIDAFLEGLAKETAESLNGSVVSAQKITLSRWPGRETKIKFAAGEIKMCLIERVFIVRDTKLFVRIVVPEERSGLPDHRKILDSFKLIDEAKHPRE
jgi:hypothetical protein